ncbi:MAG: hypothetical protein FWE33_05285 [Defluviitaleaceae bacterium]|nr:hypothetical protein [Defluviitaleaceae bacterium]
MIFIRYLTLEINGKLMPMHRGDIYEDPLQEALEQAGIGEVDGGGTLMEEDGSVACCDVNIVLNDDSEETFGKLMAILDEFLLPKGSMLHFSEEEGKEPLVLGTLEGLALHLNGTSLPAKVYKECDINHAINQILEALGDSGDMYSHWRGAKHTVIYFYGDSFEEMKKRMTPFLEEYPLCQKCVVEQVA